MHNSTCVLTMNIFVWSRVASIRAVTTDRGKLSERGGVMSLVQGRASFTLTSVNETVHKVRVRAESLDGNLERGELVLEFL